MGDQWRKEMSADVKIPFDVGDHASFSKTISESDIYLFSGISGDMNPVHVDENYMNGTSLGHRIAHGLLVFSIASSTEYLLLSHHPKAGKLEERGLTYLSCGYDKVRFLKPVFIGDTIRSVYEITQVDEEKMKTMAHISVFNQQDELVFVADHILKFLKK